MEKLVSILIPAYNCERWIVETLQSAVDQTWPHKEIILVDDGSTDRTLQIAEEWLTRKEFGMQNLSYSIISQTNRGAAAARNTAFAASQGQYIQWLDGDDILAPDKIEKQMAAWLDDSVLLSSEWGSFDFRVKAAQFIPTALWQDLYPAEWLLHKMGENLHMQTATWLTPRGLAEQVQWNESLSFDDDGDYFARLLCLSRGTQFVSGAKVYYRDTPSSLSNIGNSERKMASLIRSLESHIECLRSLERSERVHQTCVTYLQNWYSYVYASPEMATSLRSLAGQYGGVLHTPLLRSKYAWLEPAIGHRMAAQAQRILPQLKHSLNRTLDRVKS